MVEMLEDDEIRENEENESIEEVIYNLLFFPVFGHMYYSLRYSFETVLSLWDNMDAKASEEHLINNAPLN
jgi:hypothetical protein